MSMRNILCFEGTWTHC